MGDAVITAAAGCGKTTELARRYLGFLAAGVPVQGAVAITFTRRAAAELRERVTLALRACLLDDRGQALLCLSTLPLEFFTRCLAAVGRRQHLLDVHESDLCRIVRCSHDPPEHESDRREDDRRSEVEASHSLEPVGALRCM